MMNYNEKHAEMKKQAIADIIECLENGYDGYYCDLHNEVFNTDYYIIGTYKAEKSLEEYGVFDAIRLVKECEIDNFGELFTDIADPEKLVNMLYYVIGEEVIAEMQYIAVFTDNWDNVADDETNAKIVEDMKEYFNS